MIKERIIKLLLFSICLLLINYHQVFAMNVGINKHYFDEIEEKPETATQEFTDGTKKYKCTYKDNYTTSRNIVLNAYDLNGTSIIPQKASTASKATVLAGTWLGMSVKEEKTASWDIKDFSCVEIRRTYSCVKQIAAGCTEPSGCADNCPYGYEEAGSCEYDCNKDGNDCKCPGVSCKYCWDAYPVYDPHTVDFWDETTACTSGYTYDESTESTTNVSVSLTIKNDLQKKTIKIHATDAKNFVNYASLNVEIIDSNDIKEPNISRMTNSSIIDKSIIEPENATAKGESKATHEYSPSRVCMNLKTGNVYYDYKNEKGQEKTTCESNKSNQNYIMLDSTKTDSKITNTLYDQYIGKNVNYWHYFVPLNTKSNSEFYIKFSDKGDVVLDKMQCYEVLEKHQSNDDNYTTYIQRLTSNGKYESYTGEVETDKRHILNNDNGCVFSTPINFKITQKFYNEVKKNNQSILKGYGMYYRPIDVVNPFPNGITNSSYWYESYKTTNNVVKTDNKTIKLSDSFKQKTYVASKDIHGSTNEKYTSWKEMNLDGTSKLIGGDGINRLINDTKEIYKLGCGPVNSLWEVCKKT